MRYFLGIDGGQSHTEALVADGRGRLLGRGTAGASNHTRQPGGRERLINAVNQSVRQALRNAGLLKDRTPLRGNGTTYAEVRNFRFASAHLAMTGEPKDKIEIVRELLQAETLVVGHDAPAALAGALAGEEGVIVLAGTGSVACGMTRDGKFVRVGGHGYLFGDEGSGFAIAKDALSCALNCEDRESECRLEPELLRHFKRDSVEAIAEDVYAGLISRDRLASFAQRVSILASRKEAMASIILDDAADCLIEMAIATVCRLGLPRSNPTVKISYGGGVFRSRRLRTRFADRIKAELNDAEILAPRFGPAVGAVLLAYRQSDRKISRRLLEIISETHLETQS